jgi:alkanesulfonate monooxygenase SsuD/methylene tetrahydromethanopterin reductase-like flavin-dependent oxidoreductase (luciferase family)
MRFGLDFPPFGELADPRLLAEIGVVAERAGWDGVFLWDHVVYRAPADAAGDPWIGLAAIAAATTHVVVGPMVTPLPRRRPQIVARQCVALDQLSCGRFVLGAGLGLDRSGRELSAFGEELDDRRRARMLDESLDLITALWSGERVNHRGEHYLADDVRFQPEPIQQPRIPIWLAGRWPYKNPIRRAARFDGLFLIDIDRPDQLREAQSLVAAVRGTIDGFDFVAQGTPDEDPTPWSDAGATWWMTKTPYDTGPEAVMEAARNGPPR